MARSGAVAFTRQPEGGEAVIGIPHVLAAYAPTAVRYQWRKDGVPIPNATGRELVITDQVESHGTYDVVAFIDNANYTVSQPAYAAVFHTGTVLYLQ